jgi:indolepyruvate ferredoxin oxidoreductase beta subunit
MKDNRTVNIIFCGIGGQGVLKAGEVCAIAALLEGHHVKKSEVHGMAQRGGAVESHLRFGKKIYSPLIPFGQADYLVSCHQEEAFRMAKFLKPEGRNLGKCLEEAMAKIPDKRYLNIFLLGILSRALTIKERNWLKAINIVFAAKKAKKNQKIFLKGRNEFIWKI